MKDGIKLFSGKNKQNEWIYLLNTICSSVGIAISTGAYATSFMLYKGLDSQQISFINSATTAAMILASFIILFAYRWDYSGLRLLRICTFGYALAPFGFLLAGYVASEWVFIVLCVFSPLAMFMASGRNSAEITAAPVLYGRERYSFLLGFGGALAGCFNLIVSSCLVFACRFLNEELFYQILFLGATVMMIVGSVLVLYLKKAEGEQADSIQFSIHLRTIFNRKYLKKGIPHMFRGIGATGVVFFQIIVLGRLELNVEQNTALITLSIVAGIIGSIIQVQLNRFLKPGSIVMIGFVLSSVLMITAPFINDVILFFILYGCLLIMNGMACNSTMGAVAFACEREELTMMSSLHVLYYAIIYSPTMLLLGKVIDAHAVPVMLLAAMFYAISGIVFHYSFRRK